MAIIKRKVGSQTVEWDTVLGGPIVPFVNHREPPADEAPTDGDKPLRKRSTTRKSVSKRSAAPRVASTKPEAIAESAESTARIDATKPPDEGANTAAALR